MSELTVILGGARSGKSTFAERLAAAHGGQVTYLATAQAFDDEMAARIAAHRAERPAGWRTVECPLDPAAAIRAHAADTDCFLLDCLTLLVSNLLLVDATTAEDRIRSATDAVLAAYHEAGADLLLVSNEVGLGLVPEYPLGRAYRDALGRANQRLAAAADRVYVLIAGLPVEVKALAAQVIR
ncbi:MAG TPA: bifunctional adenosylcobinamide kinase/adenosylcobinamide-phosphate guanylyltransferase [Armatimonadota bacterium]|nr:bifunctional adenosylcobinamide kinase/adenosylcobinamide-phosphate guanylyltransferase [Armatimonadota bacterium]HOS44779.1 bifunctional adenosylcobinamide kinase/adenosylcobinamide-phosphate guanylyltransferase [Armatimonadota bacterium]